MGKGPFWILLGCLLLSSGCSNDSGTSGPETMSVELSVWVQEPFHGARNTTVQVAGMSAVTDTSGLAVFRSDINILVPNHTYQIVVVSPVFMQSTPEADTIKIPSSPNRPNGYVLETYVFVKPR